MAGSLRRDHADIHARRTLDGPEANVEAVGEHQRLARLQVGLNVAVIDLRLFRVVNQNHDRIGPGGGVAHGEDLQASGFGPFFRAAALVQTNANVHSAVAQVQRMGMALRTVSDDGDLRGLYQRKISVLVIKDLCHCVSPLAMNS